MLNLFCFLKCYKNRYTSILCTSMGTKQKKGGSIMKTRQIIAAIRRLLDTANMRQLELILRIVRSIVK